MHSQLIKGFIDLPDFLIQGERKEGDRWIFELSLPPHCPVCLVCFGRTTKVSSIQTEAMDPWLYSYNRSILYWTPCWKKTLLHLFPYVYRFLSGTSISQYRNGIVSTVGRSALYRKNDSRSRSLFTTCLYNGRTLVLSIYPGLFVNFGFDRCMRGWIRFP